MTIGYEDWQRYPSRIGANLYGAQSVTLPAGTKTYGPHALAGFGGLQVAVVPSSGYGTVRVDWWETSSMITSVRGDTWNVNANIGLNVIIPAFAPFATIKVDATSAGGMTFTGSARGTAVVVPRFEYPITGNGIYTNNNTLAASGEMAVVSRYIRRGPAFVSFAPADTSGSLNLLFESVNPDGSLDHHIAYFNGYTTQVNVQIIVPDEAFQTVVVNTDAAASHTYSLAVMFDG